MLGGMGWADVCEEMEGLYGLTENSIKPYWERAKERLSELQSTVEESFWARQVARLESAARKAWEQGDFIGQSALEAQLTKVAGTAAPERFIHQHQVAVVDVRAQQIDEELRRIRNAAEGPRAIAHQVSDLGVKNPEDIPSGTNTAAPERGSGGPARAVDGVLEPEHGPVTSRALRGNRTLGKIFKRGT